MKLFRSISMIAVVLAVLVFTMMGVSALAQGGPKMVTCFNKEKGLVISVPAQAAEHLNGHGGWICEKKGPEK